MQLYACTLGHVGWVSSAAAGYRIAGFDCEKKYLRITIVLLEEVIAIFDNCVHNRRYIEDI